MATERREMESKRFRIDTTVNIAHILTTMGLVTAIFTWGSDVKSMLTKHETEINEIRVSRTASQVQLRQDISDLKTDIRTLSAKVDYYLEYRPFPTYNPKKK
jgi:hypothetical protein